MKGGGRGGSMMMRSDVIEPPAKVVCTGAKSRGSRSQHSDPQSHPRLTHTFVSTPHQIEQYRGKHMSADQYLCRGRRRTCESECLVSANSVKGLITNASEQRSLSQCTMSFKMKIYPKRARTIWYLDGDYTILKSIVHFYSCALRLSLSSGFTFDEQPPSAFGPLL